MQQLSGAFTELSGIGTSSAGVCIWPIGPLLAHAAALGLSLSRSPRLDETRRVLPPLQRENAPDDAVT